MTSATDDHSASDLLLERQIEAFDAAWQTPTPPRIEDFVASVAAGQSLFRQELLYELIKIDLEYRWRRAPQGLGAGQPTGPTLEEYARRFPELGAAADIPPDLIAEEYRVRRKWGDRPTPASYLVRFPGAAELLHFLLPGVDEESLTDTSGFVETALRQANLISRSGPAAAAPPAVAAPPVIATPTLASVPSRESKPIRVSEPARVAAPAEALPARIGRYEIISLLGRGSFGAVYLALDTQLNRRVAIKAPRTDQLRTANQQESFFREARLAAQLRHPTLVEVYDVGRDQQGDCFIVLEYVEGEPLNDVVKDRPAEIPQVVAWIAAVADAVHCAHKVGLVHCDLKPANILIDAEGKPHVADFGLAVSESEQRTLAGHIAGSPAYMAPEQVRGEAHRFDGRTDLWALGAILYELLTCRKPFSGNNVKQMFDEILHREPKPLRQINEAIPADLERICLKCLAKEVRDRYTNGFDLAHDLRQTLETLRTSRNLAADARSRGFTGEDSAASMHYRSAMSGIAGGRATTLPATPASFVGRTAEIDELTHWLSEQQAPLVTLLGPGGMGKTRLALHLAEHLQSQWPGGTWFAELTECRQPADIAHAVAKALGVPLPENETPVQAVAHILEFRKPALIVLDNFEQAADAAQATVGVWRLAAPQVQFLVTSRAALHLAEERCFELGPLAIPADPQALTLGEVDQFDSLRLFSDRARQTDPAFQITERNLAAVGRICAAVEGIPLALELAAARVRIFTPDEIAQRLSQRFQLLQSSRRDLTPRQQTLWGAIEWSVGLLVDWERHAFLQVCAFRGGFDWDAAEAVVDLSAFPQAPPTLDVIQSLRDKSLLTRHETPYATRFGMYQAIREFGEQRWQAEANPAQRHALRERMASHFVGWAEAWNGRIFSPDVIEALARLHLELDNLFAVQDQALLAGDKATATRAILAAARTMAIRGPAEQRVTRFERALAAWGAGNTPSGNLGGYPVSRGQAESSVVMASPLLNLRGREQEALSHEPQVAALLTAASEAAQAAGEWDRAKGWIDQAVTLAAACEQPGIFSGALRQQGEMYRQRGEPDAALTAFASAENIARTLGDEQGLAYCLSARAFVVWQRGESDLALRLLQEADQLVLTHGALWDGIAIARRRGHILQQQGDTFQALRCYAEAEATARLVRDDRALRLAIGDRANVLATQGDFTGALECYQQAERLARRLGDKRGIAIAVGNRGILYSDRGDSQAALTCYEQAEQLNRAMKSRYGIAVNIGNRGVALCDLGRLPEAAACFDEAETLNRQMGNKFLLALNQGDRAGIFQKQERWSEAQMALRNARDLLAEVHSQQCLEAFTYEAQAAFVARRMGDIVAAVSLAEDALRLAETLSLTTAHPKLKIRTLLAEVQELAATPT